MSFDINMPIRGKAWRFGNSIDTDCINPYYRYPDDPEEVKKHVMESARPEFALGVKAGDMIVAGKNFGCGSARTGKVLYEVGIAVVLAESFSTIFMRNCIAGGDLVFVAPGVSDFLEDGQTLEIRYRERIIQNMHTGKMLRMRGYPPLIEQLYNAGGMLPYYKRRYLEENASPGN